MKNNTPFLVIAFLFFACSTTKQAAQSKPIENSLTSEKPKLVVGIVVDQMRYDYLTRFYKHYGNGGFKRMMQEGYNCKNTHFNYMPTYTAPGHASIFTGTTPKYHGIISNNWYDKTIKKDVYCVQDDSVLSLGTTSDAGKMSPRRMLTSSIADENRVFTQMQGKSIGISIKDRGAILPVGHAANGAYWFTGGSEGKFISSTYYFNDLPQWAKDFNSSGTVASYFKPWDTYYDIATYTESGSDLNTYEGGFKGKETATFPYDLNTLKKDNGGFSLLQYTPYGNSLLVDFAIAAMKGEQLGQDAFTDVFTVSFSSPDYIGHNFGVNSKEIQDTYIRLDLDLERFLNALDAYVGKGNYTVFLTADHAAVNVPAYLQSLKIPAGYLDAKAEKEHLEQFVTKKYGTNIIENISNDQVFLDYSKLASLNLNVIDVQEALANEIINLPNIDKVFTAHVLNNNIATSGINYMLGNGYNQKRSGDVLFVHSPEYIAYPKIGSTHGSPFSYDTHVPLLFMGKGINHGATFKHLEIVNITPTISALLDINYPNGVFNGTPILEVLKKIE